MSDICNWCEPPRNITAIVHLHKMGKVVWVGCVDCFKKRKESEK